MVKMFVTLEKLRTFPQKIQEFSYVKPRFLFQNSSVIIRLLSITHANIKGVCDSQKGAKVVSLTLFKISSPHSFK